MFKTSAKYNTSLMVFLISWIWIRWDKVFKNGASKLFGRQPIKIKAQL